MPNTLTYRLYNDSNLTTLWSDSHYSMGANNTLILNQTDHFEQNVWLRINTLTQQLTKKIELRVCNKTQVTVPTNYTMLLGFARFSNSSGISNLQIVNFVNNITLGSCQMCSNLTYRLVDTKGAVLTPGPNDVSIDAATNDLHIPTGFGLKQDIQIEIFFDPILYPICASKYNSTFIPLIVKICG